MIEFKRQYSMKNGNKVTKKNWHKVVAVSEEPCTNILGVPAIETAKREKGAYYAKYRLVYEKGEDGFPSGNIFREVNHNGGISGRHPTPKQAIWSALRPGLTIYIEE